jgi:Mechanosensitive ion channel
MTKRLIGQRHCVIRPTAMALLLVSVIFASDSLAASPNSPSERQVLTFIADTIDWYRHLPSAQRMGTEPTDLVFLENNQPIAAQIVRRSFEFGKAITEMGTAPKDQTAESTAASDHTSGLQSLAATRARLGASVLNAAQQLKSLTRDRATVRGADRQKLDAQIAGLQNRIQLLTSISANYQGLVGLARAASSSPDDITMESLIENLQATVPDLSADAPNRITNTAAGPPNEPYRYSMMGSVSQVFRLSDKTRIIDAAIAQTDGLAESLRNIRAPLVEPLRKQFSALSWDTTDLDLLAQQQSRLADLVAQTQAASGALVALAKQETLLKLYRSRLGEWRVEAGTEYRAASKSLLVRVGSMGAALLFLLGISQLAQRLAERHVRDPNARQMLLVSQRVLFCVIAGVLILFTFAFDLSSLATFLGLVSAGLAVGLHDILLAIGGYLLMTGKFHVRPGDKVEISGVKGEVKNLGLFEFEVTEIEESGRRTGRVVSFSNSYVFVSPATALFRQASTSA